MAETNVKFYRLGFNNPVTIDVYNLYAKDGNIVFAKVTEGAGEWDSSTSTLSAPTYRIFAGGIHYNIADADALNYVMDQVNTWKGDVTVEGSILNIISKAVSAAQIVALIDASTSNVSAKVVEVTDSDGNKHDKIKLTAAASNSTVVTTGSTAPEEAVENPKNGDYYIKEVDIYNSSVPSRTAYIYNGATSAWQALDGNVTAENVYFPDGLLRTAQFGFQPASLDIQTECAGLNLKELLEWYLVEEKYPTVTLTQAKANAGSYSISLATPTRNTRDYIDGPTNNSLVEVGTSVKFKGIELTETASHDGAASYKGFAATITGMKYKYNENAVDGPLKEKTSYTSVQPTTNASYTDNFSTAKVQMTLTNADGFTGITTANTSCGVKDGKAILSEQTGTTVEGTNTLKLSWSNNATVSRTLRDQVGVDAYTAYPLSNKGNASTNVKYPVNATSWSDNNKNAKPETYETITYTVNAVYPIYTNGVKCTSDFLNEKDKLGWVDTTILYNKDTPNGTIENASARKLESLYNYKSITSKTYYIGTGNQNYQTNGVSLIVYTPVSSGINNITAASFLESALDWKGGGCLFDSSCIVYINNIPYKKWWLEKMEAGKQHVLVKFERK